MTSSDQDRTIAALSHELDGETLTISRQDPETLSVTATWREDDPSQSWSVEIGVAGYVYPTDKTPRSICDWAKARNELGIDELFKELG